MARFSLSCYTVRLRDKRTDTYLQLDSFQGNQDLLLVFDQYLQARTLAYSVDSNNQKLLRVLRKDTQSRSTKGIVETGEYGYEAELYDVQSRSISYQRTASDAEMMPFYILANLPAHRDEGVLILQRRSQFGIRTILLNDFIEYFKSSYPTIQVEINPLVPQQLIDQYLENGRLTKVRFVSFSIPSDVTDAYDGLGHVEESGYVEYIVHAGRNRGLPLWGMVRDALSGRRNVSEMIELRDFDYDKVKVEVELAGSRKTIDLSDIMRLRANYDITSEIEVGSNGHPVFSSIDGIAQDLMGSLLATLAPR